ncbi:MAG: N-6 DNA methylase [Actinomycetota bacterium]
MESREASTRVERQRSGSSPFTSAASGAPAPSARDRDPRRRLGAFYTPRTTAEVMTEWVLRSSSDRILEPSFGDGSFLAALSRLALARGWRDVEALGVEIDEKPYEEALSRALIPRDRAIRADFLALEPFPVDAVLGNPPYVRLRHLPRDQRERALRITKEVLGIPMQSSGSVWMPFVLHASRFLRPGGRFALVLPYELTYVRYARALWEYLGATFGGLTVLRAHGRLFPKILQETVVVLADGRGRGTSVVDLKAFDTAADLAAERPVAQTSISLDRIVTGERVFLEGLLSRPLQDLLRDKVPDVTSAAEEVVDFRIGYVAGHKDFFHPDAPTVLEHGLPARTLVPAVTSTRRLKGAGLFTSGLAEDGFERLFLPPSSRDLSVQEAAYIALGERRGIHRRYKCSVRRPWFVVPLVEFPDVILSVFCELPLLMLNDDRFAASNSLLCGYLRPGRDPSAFAASWYTSLTALQCELHVHSLGGGVLVLVPNEARKVRIAPLDETSSDHLPHVDRLLRARRLKDSYSAGNKPVLQRRCGLTRTEVSLIEEGVDTLRRWRSGRRPVVSRS